MSSTTSNAIPWFRILKTPHDIAASNMRARLSSRAPCPCQATRRRRLREAPHLAQKHCAGYWACQSRILQSPTDTSSRSIIVASCTTAPRALPTPPLPHHRHGHSPPPPYHSNPRTNEHKERLRPDHELCFGNGIESWLLKSNCLLRTGKLQYRSVWQKRQERYKARVHYFGRRYRIWSFFDSLLVSKMSALQNAKRKACPWRTLYGY